MSDLERVEQRPKRFSATGWLGIGFAVLVLGIFLGLPRFLDSRKPEPFYGGALYDLQPAEEFTLTNQDGERFGTADLAGKVSYLYFGFTHCPNVCPVGLANLAMLNRLLTPEERARVQMVFISVDPERDTPEVLREYVPFFDPSFVGLTGTPGEIERVAKDYGVFYDAHPLEGTDDYTVDHSSTVYLLDAEGNLLATYRHAQLANGEAMAKDLRRVLAGGGGEVTARWLAGGIVAAGLIGCGPRLDGEAGLASGEAIYLRSCVVCHGVDGGGVNASYPPLAGSEWLRGDSRVLIAILLDGLRGPVEVAGKTYAGVMPAWRDSLDDGEIAEVASYLRVTWGEGGDVSGAEVATLREETKVRQRFWTAGELRELARDTPLP